VAQFITTIGPPARRDRVWIIRATTSLPDPAAPDPCEIPAPVLIFPRLFEPELCDKLIGLYEAGDDAALRARVEDIGDAPEQSEYVVETPGTQPQPTPAGPIAKPTVPVVKPPTRGVGAPPHKHSSSLLKRWRIRRKDRRKRRSAAAPPPSMQSQ